MPTYAEFDPVTQRWLRDETNDDTYRRPLFSVIDDNGDELDPDHHSCNICTDNRAGSRWVPNDGGAWVNAALWERSQRDPIRYAVATANMGNYSC